MSFQLPKMKNIFAAYMILLMMMTDISIRPSASCWCWCCGPNKQKYCSLSFFCSQHLTALTHFHVSAHRTKTKLRAGSTWTEHGASAQRISFGIFSCSWQTRFFFVAYDALSTELIESKAEEPSPGDGIVLLSQKWPKQMIQQWFLSVILPGLGLFLAIL